jgi:hypothetical protein
MTAPWVRLYLTSLTFHRCYAGTCASTRLRSKTDHYTSFRSSAAMRYITLHCATSLGYRSEHFSSIFLTLFVLTA